MTAAAGRLGLGKLVGCVTRAALLVGARCGALGRMDLVAVAVSARLRAGTWRAVRAVTREAAIVLVLLGASGNEFSHWIEVALGADHGGLGGWCVWGVTLSTILVTLRCGAHHVRVLLMASAADAARRWWAVDLVASNAALMFFRTVVEDLGFLL